MSSNTNFPNVFPSSDPDAAAQDFEGAVSFLDGSLSIKNTSAPTKVAQFSAASVTAGQTRVITIPDYNGTLATLAGTETLTGKTLTSPTITSPVMSVSSGQRTRFIGWAPPTLTSGTSTTPDAASVYMSQIYIPANCTLTGIAVNNGATVGTDKYVVALFSAAGAALANSALAGTTSSGADAFQSIAFTGTYAANGPAVYWIALYVNGTTDRFRSIPAVGAFSGLAGEVTGQTFGTIASVTLPTTFTADKGPVAFVY